MGLRFRRSITIFPGVRLNIGVSGFSLSLGPRGASINVGQKGVYGNLGLPGSGLSYRTRLDVRRRPPSVLAEHRLSPSDAPPEADPSSRTLEDLLRQLLVDRERPPVDWGDRALWLADPAPPEEDEDAFEQYARRIAAGRFARRMVEGDKAAWAEVLREELLNEELPFGFSFEWGIDEETGRIHVDVELPTQDTVNRLGLATMKGRELYEDVCCALLIRFTHEVFRVIPDVSEVYMSGFLPSHDPSTGAKTRDIYLRMSTDRDSFRSIDLDLVDPSSAFEGLGGAKKTRRGELVPIATEPHPN